MAKLALTVLTLATLALNAFAQAARSTKYRPAADHHQHLFSPAMAEFQKINPITAAALVGMRDR